MKKFILASLIITGGLVAVFGGVIFAIYAYKYTLKVSDYKYSKEMLHKIGLKLDDLKRTLHKKEIIDFPVNTVADDIF